MKLTKTVVASAIAALPLSAQFDDRWVEFVADPSLLSAPTISSSDLEPDLAWGDLDNDGADDLVVARVQPIMAGGKRTNMLLMSEGGVLTDRTAEYASASDVPLDMGFLTPTADRDVEVVDVNNDGWLDVVTAVGFGVQADSKAVSHPRVYINLGDDGSGDWLGLRHEDARIPVLINSITGLPVVARFNAVAAGDVNGDGFADLFFGDHDASPMSIFGGEPATLDTDDRLFLNDGAGFFMDATATSMTPAMVASNFCNSAVIADFNLDGHNDVLKQTNGASPGPAAATVRFNDSTSPGTFASLQTADSGSPYYVSSGDLNNDGRPDIVVSENGLDGIVYNLSTNPGGTVNWSSLVSFNFLSGSDDSFASNSLAVDLDGDNWQDVLISDVDPQFAGTNRRLHIYHNEGSVGGGPATLTEERESASNNDWIGVVGPTQSDLNGTHDIAVFDVNGDGLKELIISRASGTVVWRRVEHCQEDLGAGTPGLVLEACGNKLGTGNKTELRFSGGIPNTAGLLLVASSASPVFIPEIQATITAFPPFLIQTVPTDSNGEFTIPVTGIANAATVVVQYAAANGLATFFSPSNAIQLEFLGN